MSISIESPSASTPTTARGPASAGIQLYVELPTGCDEAATVEAAARRGVAVEGVGRLRISGAGPAALVLGFARLPEHRLAEAVRLLAEALTNGR